MLPDLLRALNRNLSFFQITTATSATSPCHLRSLEMSTPTSLKDSLEFNAWPLKIFHTVLLLENVNVTQNIVCIVGITQTFEYYKFNIVNFFPTLGIGSPTFDFEDFFAIFIDVYQFRTINLSSRILKLCIYTAKVSEISISSCCCPKRKLSIFITILWELIAS